MAEQLPSKNALRQTFLERRMQIGQDQAGRAAGAVYDLFFKHVEIHASSIVAGYWPIRGELDDMPILKALAQRGQVCALPHVVGADTPLVFRVWNETTPMTKGKYGIVEPSPDQRAVPDIILVPLVAFDPQRHRLGYGAGYYDRTLAALKKAKSVMTVGLAYEEQLYSSLPVEENDMKMDMIITDRQIYT